MLAKNLDIVMNVPQYDILLSKKIKMNDQNQIVFHISQNQWIHLYGLNTKISINCKMEKDLME